MGSWATVTTLLVQCFAIDLRLLESTSTLFKTVRWSAIVQHEDCSEQGWQSERINGDDVSEDVENSILFYVVMGRTGYSAMRSRKSRNGFQISSSIAHSCLISENEIRFHAPFVLKLGRIQWGIPLCCRWTDDSELGLGFPYRQAGAVFSKCAQHRSLVYLNKQGEVKAGHIMTNELDNAERPVLLYI